MQPDTELLHQKLAELMQEHREIDATIAALIAEPNYDQFKATRLKKRKLLLKDMMMRVKSQLIPDQPA